MFFSVWNQRCALTLIDEVDFFATRFLADAVIIFCRAFVFAGMDFSAFAVGVLVVVRCGAALAPAARAGARLGALACAELLVAAFFRDRALLVEEPTVEALAAAFDNFTLRKRALVASLGAIVMLWR